MLKNQNELDNYLLSNSQINKLELDGFTLYFNGQLVDKSILYLSLVVNLNKGNIPFPNEKILSYKCIIDQEIYSGSVLIYDKENSLLTKVNLASYANRTPSSEGKMIFEGSKDNLIENLEINLSLLYRRIKSSALKHQDFILGSLSKCKVSLVYLKENELTLLIKERLSGFEGEYIFSFQDINKIIYPHNSLVPNYALLSKCDLICESLASGKCVILMDSIPNAYITPMSLLNFTTLDDSINSSTVFTIFSKIYSLVGLFISLFLLGFFSFIICYEPYLLPYSLLVNTYNSFKGSVLHPAGELLLTYVFFEICYFISTKSNSSLSSSVLTIGSLLIGQILVSSGFVSEISLIVIALSFLATYLVSNSLNLNNVISLLKLFIFVCSLTFSVFGFLISSFTILVYLANQRAFNPLDSLNLKKVKDFFMKLKVNKR